jgi:hypothetical protein
MRERRHARAPVFSEDDSKMRYAVGARDGGKMHRAKTWTPKANSDRSFLLEEPSSILASPHFSNSKRYPAFLRHVVEKSLDGQAEDLKERTIGVEVFGRHPDYDTNADPVVRVSAGKVRKRLAQNRLQSPEFAITHDPAEALFRSQEGRSQPAPDHGAVLPVGDTAGSDAHSGMRTFDDVGRCQAARIRLFTCSFCSSGR